jgi:hypothetical protein
LEPDVEHRPRTAFRRDMIVVLLSLVAMSGLVAAVELVSEDEKQDVVRESPRARAHA